MCGCCAGGGEADRGGASGKGTAHGDSWMRPSDMSAGAGGRGAGRGMERGGAWRWWGGDGLGWRGGDGLCRGDGRATDGRRTGDGRCRRGSGQMQAACMPPAGMQPQAWLASGLDQPALHGMASHRRAALGAGRGVLRAAAGRRVRGSRLQCSEILPDAAPILWAGYVRRRPAPGQQSETPSSHRARPAQHIPHCAACRPGQTLPDPARPAADGGWALAHRKAAHRRPAARDACVPSVALHSVAGRCVRIAGVVRASAQHPPSVARRAAAAAS